MISSILSIFKKKKVKPVEKKVVLINYEKDMKICNVIENQSGFYVTWYNLPDDLVKLNPDGSVLGNRLIKGWLPHSGWTGDEFIKLKERLDQGIL